ncbi:single-strand DNA-binding protein [Paraburkholderia sp. GAS33]|uniref:single-stranded DNA-binding protein n=1 Tax=Paraburkholderia sp. GAS33 TaxID=3035130 RepID=UPI003D245C3E
MTNHIVLTGRFGADPEVRHLEGGVVVANARLASTDHFRDKTTGEMKQETEWHRLVFFGRLAGVVEAHLVKGSRVYVDGRLRTRKWQTSDGQDRYTTEVLVQRLEMMGGTRADAPDDSAAAPEEGDGLDDWTREYDRAAQGSQAPLP